MCPGPDRNRSRTPALLFMEHKGVHFSVDGRGGNWTWQVSHDGEVLGGTAPGRAVATLWALNAINRLIKRKSTRARHAGFKPIKLPVIEATRPAPLASQVVACRDEIGIAARIEMYGPEQTKS